MTVWADYSFARPDLAQLKAAGVVGVLRYLSPDDQNTHGKILFPPEKDMLLHAGFDITLNFEWYQGRCNEGAVAGQADGATALIQAQSLGYPQTKCIYFSHDTGTYNWPQIEAYFRAVKTALGGYYKIGCYGSNDLCQHLEGLGLVDHSWQTLAWSNGQRDPRSVIYQDGGQLFGGAADTDIVSSTDIGSWLDGPGDDVTPAELKAALTEVLKGGGVLTDLNTQTTQLKQFEQSLMVQIEQFIDSRLNGLKLNLDTAALAAAISSKIVLPSGSGLTGADVKQSVKDALKEGTGV